jgi:hypothetical protein
LSSNSAEENKERGAESYTYFVERPVNFGSHYGKFSSLNIFWACAISLAKILVWLVFKTGMLLDSAVLSDRIFFVFFYLF